jgi:hypothetical protein
VNRLRLTVARGILVALVASTSACDRGGSYENLMDLSVCDPDGGSFTTEVDNPYLPFPVGHQVVLGGEDSDVMVRITVLDETETVAGVQTRVVEEYEEIDGRVVEISRNFFAQAEDGTVCYFGEEVDIYDDEGNVTSHSGAWRADGDRYLPGIFMPADPTVGQAFQQEVAPGVAEDQSKVVARNETVEVPGGTFDDTAELLDRNPLDGSEDTKIYAAGIGLIVDETAQLTTYRTP